MNWIKSHKLMLLAIWVLVIAILFVGIIVTWHWSKGHLISPREAHSAFLLPDGKVFIVGGYKGPSNELTWINWLETHFRPGMYLRSPSNINVSIDSGELYDPITNTFSRWGRFPNLMETTQLSPIQLLMINTDFTYSLYYPELNVLNPPNKFNFDNAPLELHTARLTDHSILLMPSDYNASPVFTWEFNLTAGNSTKPLYPNSFAPPLVISQIKDGVLLALFPLSKVAKIYDQSTHRWLQTQSPLKECKSDDLAVNLADGGLLLIHGTGHCEIFSAANSSWTQTDPLIDQKCNGTTVVLLKDGKVLDTGEHCYLYDPITAKWTQTGTMIRPRWANTATLLLNGKVLVTGGEEDSTSTTLSSCELYDPQTGQWSEL